jgi:hypothetical protein
MHVGADIREGLTNAHALNKFKTNIFGRGYEGGSKASVGCSRKGRIWSFQVAGDINEWVAWCHAMGEKLLNQNIDVSHVLQGAMIPMPISSRPDKFPVTIEWADDLLERDEETISLTLGGLVAPFHDVGLELSNNKDAGPLKFRVCVDAWPARSAEYTVQFSSGRVDYLTDDLPEPTITIGKKTRPLSEYLQEECPWIRFHDGSFLSYDNLFTPPGIRPAPFDRAHIETWPWLGVDLTKESQHQIKRPDSIQRHVIEQLLSLTQGDRFDVVFDDDESGDAALPL